MAQYTGVEAGSWPNLIKDWWQFVLIAFILASIGLGLTFVFYIAIQRLIKAYKKRKAADKAVSQSTKKYLAKTCAALLHHKISRVERKPESFGVYLGRFNHSPRNDELQLLARWDLIVVNPFQEHVIHVLSCESYPSPAQVLARFDVGESFQSGHKKPIELAVEWVTKLVESSTTPGNGSCFTGILLSNWSSHMSSPLIIEFIILIHKIGFSVYLETSSPEFLSNPKLAELDQVSGLVIRNGTISANGEERDAFQMAEMRPAIKAFVSQACLRSFNICLWETLDDDATPLNAVTRRTYQWSKFYNALPFITSVSGLGSVACAVDQKEPLGAFSWLKEPGVMEAHKKWRSNQNITFEYQPELSGLATSLMDSLSVKADLQPSIETIRSPFLGANMDGPPSTISNSLNLSPQSSQHDLTRVGSRSPTPTGSFFSIGSQGHRFSEGPYSYFNKNADNPISMSPTGSSNDFLGCFPLGVHVSRKSFEDVRQTQRSLKTRDLLEEIEHSSLKSVGEALGRFCNSTQTSIEVSGWIAAIQELAQQLSGPSEDSERHIKVYKGLDSGFQVQPNVRFWAVYSLEEDSQLDIFLSRNCSEISGTILHTFLSSRGCPRHECFEAEVAFYEWSTSSASNILPPRLLNDVNSLSPTEVLQFVQLLNLSTVSGDEDFIYSVRFACERYLLEATDFTQLKETCSFGYLGGQVSQQNLIALRTTWYSGMHSQHPEEFHALDVFEQIDRSMTLILKERKLDLLQVVTKILAQMCEADRIDARTDILCLAVFCAMRKHAFDEAYVEVTDRNTLFNDQSDQAAAFAELFATGARCESYFDMTPSSFGKLLSERYRTCHHKPGREPPIWSDANPTTPSAYAAAKIDIGDFKKPTMSGTMTFTFLSVFAIPALIDILLLTTTGKGLYLSGNMSRQAQHSATLALMISLLISGSWGTWITCGGSYYLISMAFSAMNMFIITRLIGGLAFTLAVGIIGFVAVSIKNGVISGVVFFLYLFALSTYLCLLATLANFSYPGSTFQSGRPVILMIIPFLFISPITTIFVPGYDIYIYLTVLYIFVFLLAVGTRNTASKWPTWHQKIESISDKALKEWYIKTHKNGDEKAFTGMTDPAALKISRNAMIEAITKVRSGFKFRRQQCKDPVVKSLANSYEATLFLLGWYSSYSGTPLPMPYSSTWNMQIKVALDTLKQMQTGLKLHNAFIHWRQAGDEVGCSLLYFIVALLDKWTSLLAGGRLLGLSALNTKYRMPVGFALAYYLIGAVLLDLNATKLHKMTSESQNMLVGDVSSIPEAVKAGVKARRHLYWSMLGRYTLFHVWSLAVSSTLLWVFDSTEASTLLFVSYVGAYTGLLWYQYTKIFSGPRSLKPLLVAVVIGLPLGQILRHFFPQFEYCDVVALGVATWTSAILSLYYARIKSKPANNTDSENRVWNKISQDRTFHEFTSPGRELLLSQDELQITFENLHSLGEDEKYEIEPSIHPGVEIRSILQHALELSKEIRGSPVDSIPNLGIEAFPEAVSLLEETIAAFDSGKIVIQCVSMNALSNNFKDLKAISCDSIEEIKIIVGCEMMDALDQQSSISVFCQTTAEILVHVTAESFLNISHEHASLLESLLASLSPLGLLEHTPIPQSLRNYLNFSKPSRTQAEIVITNFENELLYHTALGCNPNLDWERLPTEVRALIIRRCTQSMYTLTTDQREWIRANKANGRAIETYLSRCNFGAFVALSKKQYTLTVAKTTSSRRSDQDQQNSNVLNLLKRSRQPKTGTKFLTRRWKLPFSTVYHNFGHFLKLFAISFVAEPELQRELDYTLKSAPRFVRACVLFIATGIWAYTKIIQDLVMPMFLLHGRKNVDTLWKQIGGTTVSLKRQKISIECTGGSSTAFVRFPDGSSSHSRPRNPGSEAVFRSLLGFGKFEIYQYSGVFDQEPTDTSKLERISIYSKDLLLLRRDDYINGVKANGYEYDYGAENVPKKTLSRSRPRYPISRRCVTGKNQFEEVSYNTQGLVQSGSYILDGSLVRFSCHYRQNSNFDDELLRAEFVLPHLTCTVSWAAPPAKHQEKLDQWIPHSQVLEATFVIGAEVYEAQWSYDHKYHPTIFTTLNGEPIDTPPLIQWDHLGVLKKPANLSFRYDDPIIGFKSLQSHVIPRWLGRDTHKNPVSTSRARSRLWKAWKENSAFDGVIMRWLDERLLRREPLLRPYFRRRDHGHLRSAEEYLHENADAIMAVIDLDKSISGWAPLAFQISDLYAFGQGGGANARTRSPPEFKSDELHVLATDSGTWPNEGGGVSACRRDMVNNLKSAKWYMIAESANDFGVPKHQTQENVQTLKVIPIWGLDFLTPTHGIFQDRLDSEVVHVVRDSTKQDIERNFLPILKTLVKGARTSHYTKNDILQCTRALVGLNAYFSEQKHWSGVWNSRIVKDAWRNLWISQDLVSPTPSEGWFQTEIPTIAQLDAAIDLWFRYLFIFSLPVPEKVPSIFQASHHSVSASYGIVCKITRGCQLQIWDHAISWRETNLYLSSDLCTLAPFVRNSLLGLMKITSQLILHHADVILPCADFFNPGWEVEIGSSRGELEHRNIFRRKIDPVVNGIPPADISKFSPIQETNSELPTVTMLSHVWYAKDIKTAILAADIIVNEWGFKDYRLDIYGAIDKAPQYSTDCFEILASKSLPGYVTLCGTASPTNVLKKTWAFLNSSISEGLPLALGEAALTGAPVICTDVGASLRVLTDPDTGDCFSEVVAPNDARSLARAQINMLALLDQWAPYAEDPDGYHPPSIIDKPTPEEVAIITKRMYEKKSQLRALGMKSREIVQRSFGGNRYLREHEQMLWIGKARYDIQHPSAKPRPRLRPAMPSLPVQSNMWGQVSVHSGVQSRIQSRVQSRPPLREMFRESSLMVNSMQASTRVPSTQVPSTPRVPSPGIIRPLSPLGYTGIKSLSDYMGSGYRTGDSAISTPDVQYLTPPGIHSVRSHSPMKKTGMSPRVTVLSRGSTSYDRSESSSMMMSKRLPGEDSFLRDLESALERVDL